MVDLNAALPAQVREHLAAEEKEYLAHIFERFGGYPGLAQIWQLMDEAWLACGCDPNQMDERVAAFYRHPVWLLNGLFIEQHAESLENRRAFTEWIVRQAPARVADFGGGFGSLARFVGQALPGAQVEVVESHPRAVAVMMAANTPNVRFTSKLTGEYDLLIATDVFEHVADPLGLCAETAAHLKTGGRYLIANCFQPVIKCHLPQLFYFEYGWDTALQAMGLLPGEQIQYGRAFQRIGPLDLPAARKMGERARLLYPFLRHLPRGRVRLGVLAMKYWRYDIIRR